MTSAKQQVVVDVILSTDATRAIAMLKESDEKYVISQFDINTNQILMSIELEGEYIKASIIEQNKKGDKFLVAYMDNGIFHLLAFDYDSLIEDFNINEHFGIDNTTIPFSGFF